MALEVIFKYLSVPALIMMVCMPCFSMESNNSEIKDFARGCWLKERWDQTSRSWSSNRLCFKDNDKIESFEYFNRFGRDDTLDWKFVGNKSIVISDSTCDVVLINDNLSEIKNCEYAGKWNRTCAVMDEKNKDCFK